MSSSLHWVRKLHRLFSYPMNSLCDFKATTQASGIIKLEKFQMWCRGTKKKFPSWKASWDFEISTFPTGIKPRSFWGFRQWDMQSGDLHLSLPSFLSSTCCASVMVLTMLSSSTLELNNFLNLNFHWNCYIYIKTSDIDTAFCTTSSTCCKVWHLACPHSTCQWIHCSSFFVVVYNLWVLMICVGQKISW